MGLSSESEPKCQTISGAEKASTARELAAVLMGARSRQPRLGKKTGNAVLQAFSQEQDARPWLKRKAADSRFRRHRD